MSRPSGSAAWAAAASPSKKNGRHRDPDRVPAGIRHRRRSHHRREMVPPHDRQSGMAVGDFGITVSASTVARLLEHMGYSLRVNQHRLFSEISKNWPGEPLDSYQKMLRFIRSTRTQTGLAVTA